MKDQGKGWKSGWNFVGGFMASQTRVKTSYPGVFYRLAERKGKPGEERVYYIVFKQDSKVVEEADYPDNNVTPSSQVLLSSALHHLK